MEVTLNPLSGERGERQWLRSLYRSAFPREERPPFFLLNRRSCRDCWRIVHADGRRAGFLYLLRQGSLVYLFFFAVDPAFRGQGVGSAALRRLTADCREKRLFLLIEPPDPDAPNAAERRRRLEFYLRARMQETGLQAREGPVVYDLLACGAPPSSAEYRRLVGPWFPAPVRPFKRLAVFPKAGQASGSSQMRTASRDGST